MSTPYLDRNKQTGIKSAILDRCRDVPESVMGMLEETIRHNSGEDTSSFDGDYVPGLI